MWTETGLLADAHLQVLVRESHTDLSECMALRSSYYVWNPMNVCIAALQWRILRRVRQLAKKSLFHTLKVTLPFKAALRDKYIFLDVNNLALSAR